MQICMTRHQKVFIPAGEKVSNLTGEIVDHVDVDSRDWTSVARLSIVG